MPWRCLVHFATTAAYTSCQSWAKVQARKTTPACCWPGPLTSTSSLAATTVRFHDFLPARAQGLALVLPGHYATERCGAEELAG
jgi:hypothetical protein